MLSTLWNCLPANLLQDISEFRGSLLTFLFQECDTWVNLVVIVLLGCLLSVRLLLFIVFVVLCIHSDTEEQSMAEYLELKHSNQSINLASERDG